MLRLLLDRLVFSVLTLLAVGLCLFVLTRSIAGTPARIVLGNEATADQIAAFDAEHGLDQPVFTQYLRWVGSIAGHLDFGRSLLTGKPVTETLAESMPITLQIVGFAFLFAVAVALPLGIVSACYPGSLADHVTRIVSVLGVSMPGFWLGLMLIRFPAVEFGWFPPGGYVPVSEGWGPHLQSLVLPSFTLGIYYIAILSRMTRSGLLEVRGLDYIRTARAMGIGRGRMLVYALKNALVPVVSVAAMAFGYMFGWALIVEYLFNLPGMSNGLLTAITSRDYTLVQAIVLVFTMLFILSNLVADLINAMLNPRLGVAR
ncbi:ABC transporter permease [Roseomonas sp. HJA6]|uniref:ABC transporter permease n=1 Tax=Roseomonas alba TaxID=2846776 RepID=A0ABS7ABV9_9PROT|nr:ABC transporter permease [Neoroseomonas alba]MBW6399257.1 ABC transporter permease [Neoroseomonas alba]